jgi:dynein heavy chain
MKEWPAFNDLKKKIDDFNELCPVLERMLNKSMKERHWVRIEEVTGWKFDVESDGFLLRHVMEAPLLSNIDEIEVKMCMLAVADICWGCCLHAVIV